MSNRKLKQQHLRDQSALTPPATVPVVDPPVPVPMPSGSNIVAAVEVVKQARVAEADLVRLDQATDSPIARASRPRTTRSLPLRLGSRSCARPEPKHRGFCEPARPARRSFRW